MLSVFIVKGRRAKVCSIQLNSGTGWRRQRLRNRFWDWVKKTATQK